MLQWILAHKKTILKTAALMGVLLAAFFYLPASVNAQTVADPNSSLNEGVSIIKQPLGLPALDVRTIIANIIKAALGLLGLVMVILLLYGGYMWMTAGGNEEQIGQAKKIISNAVVGLIIILSAYAIVLFVLKLLGIGGANPQALNLNPPEDQNFLGSGSLGTVIKDHYPARDQKEVPRNTKIVITFYKPVLVKSFAVNAPNQISQNQGLDSYGDCINIGAKMDWAGDCDHLILDNDHINITRSDNGQQISGAAIAASRDADGKVYTIVIRPDETLGNDTDKIGYKVHIGGKVLLDDEKNQGRSIFYGRPASAQFYDWNFICSTELDKTPPYAVAVFPKAGSTEARNSVIQITFSEAVDPTGLQGMFANSSDYYYIPGSNNINSIYLKSLASSIPLGAMRIVNGYQTLEFTPSIECGTNACGGKIYCLPVCDKPRANCDQAEDADGKQYPYDNYKLLTRAAQTFNVNSFEAIPFSGIMDMAGNALDGNNNKAVEQASLTAPIFSTTNGEQSQEMPDNYWWQFRLSSKIDLTPPYIQDIAPGVDAAYVAPEDPLTALFSKIMRVEPLYGIAIDERPAPATDPLCHVPRVSFGDNTTLLNMLHCPFLNNARHYYYPVITSDVEDAHFNCLYPGNGPSGKNLSGETIYCDVKKNPENEAFCCNGGVDKNNEGWSTTDTCLNRLKSANYSPL